MPIAAALMTERRQLASGHIAVHALRERYEVWSPRVLRDAQIGCIVTPDVAANELCIRGCSFAGAAFGGWSLSRDWNVAL